MNYSHVIRKLTRAGAVAGVGLLFLLLNAIPSAADPEALSDQELDSVSARGFAFRSIGVVQPMVTNITPSVSTDASADTDVKNIILAISKTTNINTAVNTCVLAVCSNSGASIESNPTTVNEIEVNNTLEPTVQSASFLPITTVSNLGAPQGGGAPPSAIQPNAASNGSYGFVKTRPPLPKHIFGIRQ